MDPDQEQSDLGPDCFSRHVCPSGNVKYTKCNWEKKENYWNYSLYPKVLKYWDT